MQLKPPVHGTHHRPIIFGSVQQEKELGSLSTPIHLPLDKVPLVGKLDTEMVDTTKFIVTPYRLYEAAKILALCIAYMGIGPTLILLNKHILRDLDGRGFNYPMFLSGLGLLSSSLAAYIAVRVFKVELQQQKKITWAFYFRNVLPVGASQALTLAAGNAVYMYLTVSFIQMLKAFTPVMVLIVGVLFSIEAAEPKIVGAVVGISAGTAIASFGEVNFNIPGIMFMLFAEFTEAIRLVLTQYLLKNLKFSVIESQYYLAPAGAMCLFTASLLTEFPSMARKGAFGQVMGHPGLFFAAATLGLGVHMLCFLVVQATNSVTLKVLGTARNAFLVVASVYVYGEIVTSVQLFGYLIALGFFGLYTYHKTQGMTKA